MPPLCNPLLFPPPLYLPVRKRRREDSPRPYLPLYPTPLVGQRRWRDFSMDGNGNRIDAHGNSWDWHGRWVDIEGKVFEVDAQGNRWTDLAGNPLALNSPLRLEHGRRVSVTGEWLDTYGNAFRLDTHGNRIVENGHYVYKHAVVFPERAPKIYKTVDTRDWAAFDKMDESGPRYYDFFD